MGRSLLALFGALAMLVALPLATPSPPAYAQTACASPRFTTSDAEGTWTDGSYVVANDMWNASAYRMTQRLTACGYGHWHVDVTADNRAGDGAVKTYPNVHRDFIDWETDAQPRLSSFSAIRSSFAAWTPSKGIYDAAYDVWLNRLNREIMIWTVNRGQRPAGNVIRSHVLIGGHRWNIWSGRGNRYVAFVAVRPLRHASLDLKAMLDWLWVRDRIPPKAKLAQICFGFEIVSTDATPATFGVSRFSITATPRHSS